MQLRYSGRAVRAAARRLRHTRQQRNQRITRVPPLPARVTDLAFFPLPLKEPAFLEAIEDDFDDSCVAAWKKPPPFNLASTASTCALEGDANYNEDTYRLECALHGVQLRQEHEQNLTRRRLWKESSHKKVMDALREEFVELRPQWEVMLGMRGLYDMQREPRAHAMYELHLRWLARRLWGLLYLEFLRGME